MNRRSLLSGSAALAAMASLEARAGQPPGVSYSQLRTRQLITRMGACRQRPVPDATTNDTTNNSLNSRMVCFAPARAALTDVVLSIPGFGFNNPEADLPTSTFTVTASIEYPIGTFTPVYTQAGSRTLTVVAGHALTSFDPCPIVIPAGAKFYTKLFVQWAAGNFWLTYQTAAASQGEWTARGMGLTDQTLTTTTQTTTSGAGFGPVVFGRFSTPTAVLGILGDSISQSIVCPPNPVTGEQFIEAAMLGQLPVINLARSSDSMGLFLQRPYGRNAILRDSITHLICAYGRNDMNDSFPVSFFAGELQATIQPFLDRGVQVLGVTVTPYTTSTDSWITTANQTPVTLRETTRVNYNAWLRANWASIGMSGLFDWAHVVDPTDSGKWNVDGTSGNNGAGFATLSGGGVASAAIASYGGGGNSTGTLYAASTPCVVYAYPGDPTGSGAVLTATSSNSNNADGYTVVSPGSGYLFPPMIAPHGRWTNEGIHPTWRAYMEIIKQTGLSPSMFVL